jgi:phytoene dehydrogenase-like protein
MGETRGDVVVIGAGLGGLTAAALLAKAGRHVTVIERNHALGGAASVFKVGDLTIEPSLHQTADPRDPDEPKHAILAKLGVLDAVEWVPISPFQTVEGGPVGASLDIPVGFEAARDALAARFPRSAAGLGELMDDMALATRGVAQMSAARESRSLGALWRGGLDLRGLARDWRVSLADVLQSRLGDDEAAKLAVAGNIAYYADTAERLAWPFFAVAQGGFFKSGGVYVKGGSHKLSLALAKIVTRAGGKVRLGREAVAIELQADGRPAAVRHVETRGRGDEERIAAPIVLMNGGPEALAQMLAAPAQDLMRASFAARPLSISLFTAHFGLAEPPAKFGLTRYGVTRLPGWLTSMSEIGRGADLLGDDPSGRMPVYGLTNYGAIDSGIGDGGLSLVTAVGVDRLENWVALPRDQEKRRREAWLDAFQADIDLAHPGFGSAVRTRMFLNARSMRDFLSTPGGAVYGFAPQPFQRRIWAGPPGSVRTPAPGIYLASAFGEFGGYTGAIRAGAAAAEAAMAG